MNPSDCDGNVVSNSCLDSLTKKELIFLIKEHLICDASYDINPLVSEILANRRKHLSSYSRNYYYKTKDVALSNGVIPNPVGRPKKKLSVD